MRVIIKNFLIANSFITFLFLLPGVLFADTFTTSFTNPANYTYPNEIEVNGGLAKLKGSSLWNGLQGYWKMDDVSGQITDSSGNNNNGTDIVGGIGYGYSGKINNSINFKEGGVNGKVNITEQNSLAIIGAFSYGAWFKADSFSSWAGIISRMRTWGHGYNLQVGTTQRIACGDGLYTNSDFMPVTGQWYHAVCVYDGSKMQLYVNGVKQTDEDTHAIDVGSDNLQLGVFYTRAGTSISLPFDGVIDEAFVYNRALTPSEITELYNAGNGKEITQYSNGTFTISKTNGNSASAISQFTNFQVTPGVLQGSLHFQLSTDGTHWKYWDGNTWTNAQTNNDTNTEAEVNTHISSFPTNTNTIYVKTFLTGDGTQRTEIDEINIQYETNNAPTDIKLNGADQLSIQEGTANGTSIATLTTTDADAGDTHTYSLVNGTGDEDNTKFTLTGDQLKLNFTPDFENPTDLGDTPGNNTYSIRIQTDDGNGGSYQKPFIITVTDVDENAPIISLLGSPVITITQGDTYTDSGATAQDNEDGDITANIIVVNPVDTNTPGTYTISYNVSDSAGNVAQEVVRTVHVLAQAQISHRKKRRRKISLSQLWKIFHPSSLKKEEGKTSDSISHGDRECNLSTLSGMFRYGDENEGVKKIQICLNSIGIDAGPEDGIFGKLTEKAVLQFQRTYHLRFVDGIVGPEDGIFGSLTENAVFQFQRDYHLRFVDGIVGKETIHALSQSKKENA